MSKRIASITVKYDDGSSTAITIMHYEGRIQPYVFGVAKLTFTPREVDPCEDRRMYGITGKRAYRFLIEGQVDCDKWAEVRGE